MDITNIENEWKDLKNNKKRQTDLNNILKDLDAEPDSKARDNSAKDQVKNIVKTILEEEPVSDSVKIKTQKSKFEFDFDTFEMTFK